MWLLGAMMWLHERHRGHTRAEERDQPDHRTGGEGGDDHCHASRQADRDHCLLDYLPRPGKADRERNGSAGQRQAPPPEAGEAPWTRPDGRGVRLRRPPLSLYLDTSALIKLLVEEPGSDIVNQAYDSFPTAS